MKTFRYRHGLSSVRRIIERHGNRDGASGHVGASATTASITLTGPAANAGPVPQGTADRERLARGAGSARNSPARGVEGPDVQGTDLGRPVAPPVEPVLALG